MVKLSNIVFKAAYYMVNIGTAIVFGNLLTMQSRNGLNHTSRESCVCMPQLSTVLDNDVLSKQHFIVDLMTDQCQSQWICDRLDIDVTIPLVNVWCRKTLIWSAIAVAVNDPSMSVY